MEALKAPENWFLPKDWFTRRQKLMQYKENQRSMMTM